MPIARKRGIRIEEVVNRESVKEMAIESVEILEDPEKNMDDLNEAIRLNPRQASLYSKRANFRKKYLGDNQGAIEDYTKAIRINPDNALLYFWRSHTYHELGNRQKSIEDYNEAVRLAPEGTLYWNFK